MRIATWNINSLRLRMPLLARLTQEVRPDVVCLQEIKVHDDHFPADAIRALGYSHIAYSGIKNYNGVAILSRLPLQDVRRRTWCGREDARYVSAELPGGVAIHNFYVPAGGDEPDPDRNEKFAHKLAFLDEMAAWLPATHNPRQRLVLVGDLNVAPLETDVWSHKQLLKVVSHTPVEVERLARVQATLGWVDAVREFIPPQERLYSWWSYRARDWAASDRGRRLDHIWVTPALQDRLAGARVLREARGWISPSDHVPVVAEISA